MADVLIQIDALTPGQPNLALAKNAAFSLADATGGPAPVSRKWKLLTGPSPIAVLPTLSTDTASTSGGTTNATWDGMYLGSLTRVEANGTTSVGYFLLGVPDADGLILPCAMPKEVDIAKLFAIGATQQLRDAAALSGWTGGAPGSLNVFLDAYLRTRFGPRKPIAFAGGATQGLIRAPNPHTAYADVLIGVRTYADDGDMPIVKVDASNNVTWLGESGGSASLVMESGGNVNLTSGNNLNLSAVAFDLLVNGGDAELTMSGSGVNLAALSGPLTLNGEAAGIITLDNKGIATTGLVYGNDHVLADSNATINVNTGSNWVLATPTNNRTTRLGAATGKPGTPMYFTRVDTAAFTWAFLDDVTGNTLYTFASATPGKLKVLWDDVNGRWRFDEQELTP